MKKIILAVVLACLSLAAPVWADEPPASGQASAGGLELVRQIKEQDLYGVWLMAAEEGDDALINMTVLTPKHTGTDIMWLRTAKGKVMISQEIKWAFNPKTQEFTQTVQSFKTIRDEGEEQEDKSKIGQRNTVKVRLLKVDGKPSMIEFDDGVDKSSYFKQDEGKFLEMLRELRTSQ